MIIRQRTAQLAASFGIAGLGAGFLTSNIVAWRLGWQPALGAPLAHYSGWPVYAPWDILTWAKWQSSVPDIHTGLIVAAAGLALPLVGHVMKMGKRASSVEFGSKEWGTVGDARKGGLFSKDGVVVGKLGGQVLRFAGDQHTLFAGASGSGKSAGPVVSTLLSMQDRSVLVLDPKGELYKMTAPFRSKLGAAFFFDPTEETSARFNPLAEVPVGTSREIGVIQNIANVLIDSSGLKNSDPFWPISASTLMTAIILFAVHKLPPAMRKLGSVRDIMFDMDTTLQRMETCGLPEAERVAVTMLNMGDRQRDGITATAQAALSIWADPRVDELTSRSDFTISDLVCAKYPMSLYLQVPPSDRARLMPLFRVIMVMVFKAFLWKPNEMPDGRKKLRRMQFVAEEFPAAGKLPDFAQDIQELRGFGVSCMLMCQSLQNLDHTYGSNAIRDNCHIVTCFASADTKSMKDISEATGHGVETKVSVSQKVGEWFGGTKSTSHTRRPLLDPGAVRMLGMDEAIILVTGTKPIRGRKVRWFKDRRMRKDGVNLVKHPDTPLKQNEEILAMRIDSGMI